LTSKRITDIIKSEGKNRDAYIYFLDDFIRTMLAFSPIGVAFISAGLARAFAF
jgi:hypothetical protein